jgi:hypothetical protein
MLHGVTQTIKLIETLADATFKPRPAFLNLVEVWRIRRQVDHFTPRLFNQLFNTSPFMEGGIIDDQPLSRLQGANQAGFNPSFKDCAMFLAPSIVKGAIN